ncbi:AsmA family protein [Piscinibacter sp.]|jgi:AsmA protein|uniref:AsmA family protein n=1 Tax=Piscinibacter sp. TaxID=1903157 RepID=UPI002F40ADC3
MPVWLRRGLWGVGALLLVLVLVAGYLVSTFDANRYKSVAIDWMKVHRNRSLVIDGPIELSVFPRLAVKLSKLRLSEVGKPDDFAALDEAGLAVDVLPLLRGQLVIDRVRAKGVRVVYVRDPKSKSNLDDLLQSEPAEPGSAKALRFDVSGIELSDVRARVKDEVAGVDGELLLKSLTTGRIANKVESKLKLAAQFDFKAPALKGELTGDTRLTLDTETRSVSVRDMNLAFKGDLPSASGVDALLKGSLAWDGAKNAVDAQALELKLAATAAGLKFSGTTLAVERFAFDAARKSLTMRRLQARVKATQGGHPLSLDLDWPELAVTGNQLGGSAFSGKFSRGGELPLDAQFKSRAPSGNFDAIRVPGFEAQLASHAPQRKIAGTLRCDLTLNPARASLTFDALDLQAKVDEATLPPLALGVRGNATASAQRSSWNLSGQLNTNAFSSDGTLILTGATPQLTAKARFDTLDLNRLLSPSSPAAAKAPAPAPADTPLDLSGLRSVNAQLNLQAGSFAWRQYRVADARIDATLDAGMLRVTQLKGRAWGGQLDATAFADARASRVAVKGVASGVNVNALVKDVAAKDWIEGTGRVTLDIDSAGRSVGEMKSRLKGNAALQLRDGAIKGINLAKTLRETRAALSMKQDTARKSNQTEKTDFSELNATFQIADGVARNKDLDVKSPFLRLSGEGAIDIGRGRIDYLARATVAATAAGQGGAELAALKGVTVPVRLSGPFEAMAWNIEWSAVIADTVANRVRDKLSEKLKGLFK